MILRSRWAELKVEPPDSGGDHSLNVSIKDDDSEAWFAIRPDEALALGAFLYYWGEMRMDKEGI